MPPDRRKYLWDALLPAAELLFEFSAGRSSEDYRPTPCCAQPSSASSRSSVKHSTNSPRSTHTSPRVPLICYES